MISIRMPIILHIILVGCMQSMASPPENEMNIAERKYPSGRFRFDLDNDQAHALMQLTDFIAVRGTCPFCINQANYNDPNVKAEHVMQHVCPFVCSCGTPINDFNIGMLHALRKHEISRSQEGASAIGFIVALLSIDGPNHDINSNDSGLFALKDVPHIQKKRRGRGRLLKRRRKILSGLKPLANEEFYAKLRMGSEVPFRLLRTNKDWELWFRLGVFPVAKQSE